jgi:RNA polymerase sigma factor (TIGR02999 family)
MSEGAGQVSRLLHAWAGGDLRARDELAPLVYHELRRRASGYLRHERLDHTLQATALVHEAFMRLAGQDRVAWQNRGHFYAVAAQMMRRILVDYARERRAAKRPDPTMRVDLDDRIAAPEPPGLDVVMLDAALTELSTMDPRPGPDCGAAVLRRPVGAGGRRFAVGVAYHGHSRMETCPRVALSPLDSYLVA